MSAFSGRMSYVIAAALCLVILGSIGFVAYQQLFRPKTTQDLQTKTDITPEEFTEAFFAESFLVKEENTQGLLVKVGFKTVEAGEGQEAGTLLGVRITGEIPDGFIPVVWAQFGGAWTDFTLTPVDPENPVLFGVLGLPRNIKEVSALNIRMETSGALIDQPTGPVLWELTELLRNEGLL